MPLLIISDTSCLILFSRIGELPLLKKLYGTVVITQIVADEFGEKLPDWIAIKNPSSNPSSLSAASLLDEGEASAIALALEHPESLLIIDEQKGRKVARQLGIRLTGTLGVIAQAKLQGHIPAAMPIFKKILQTDFRLSRDLVEKTLRQLNEAE